MHAENGAKMAGDLSTMNISKAHRYSFRSIGSMDSHSQILDSTGQIDKYSLLKNDYEGLRDELAKRNSNILHLQVEMKELKSRHAQEKEALIEKLRNFKMTNEDYEQYQMKIELVIKENEDLSKKLYQRELENKQNMINRNHDIKELKKQIIELTGKIDAVNENKVYHSNKYKTEIILAQEKYQKSEANLKNRIKLLELEVEQNNSKSDNKVDQAVFKLKIALEKKTEEAHKYKKKAHKLKLEVIERDNKIADLLTSDSGSNKKYQELIKNYLKEQEKNQRLENMLIANVEHAKEWQTSDTNKNQY